MEVLSNNGYKELIIEYNNEHCPIKICFNKMISTSYLSAHISAFSSVVSCGGQKNDHEELLSAICPAKPAITSKKTMATLTCPVTVNADD